MSKKRQLLIETALDLFYRHGINSIGINEILKVSGLQSARSISISTAKKHWF